MNTDLAAENSRSYIEESAFCGKTVELAAMQRGFVILHAFRNKPPCSSFD